MFQLSTKTHYGVTALLDLADAYGDRLVQIRELVEKHDIPKSYLEQIFNRLTKFGVVKSVRGNRGGYQLGQAPDILTLLEVCEVLEGPLDIVHGKGAQSLNTIFRDIEVCTRNSMAITIAELAERERTMNQEAMYYI